MVTKGVHSGPSSEQDEVRTLCDLNSFLTIGQVNNETSMIFGHPGN